MRVQITHRNLTVHTGIHLQHQHRHRHRDEEEEEDRKRKRGWGKKEGDEKVTQQKEQTKRRI